MDIELGMEYSYLIGVGINMVTKTWVGFINIHLRSLHKDDIALLKAGRAFVMEMEDGEKKSGKVETCFELITKARILRLHLRGDTLRDKYAHTISKK